MPIKLKRTVAPETTIFEERERLAKKLKEDPTNSQLKYEIDILDWVLSVFADYRRTTEQNEKARLTKAKP